MHIFHIFLYISKFLFYKSDSNHFLLFYKNSLILSKIYFKISVSLLTIVTTPNFLFIEHFFCFFLTIVITLGLAQSVVYI